MRHLSAALMALVMFCGCSTTPDAPPNAPPAHRGVLDFGAVGDGKTDCTAAFQAAMDAVHAAGGGTVHVPVGNFLFKGRLNIPSRVTLQGVWTSVPSHNGLRNAGLPKPTDDGTTFLVTADRGSEDAPAFITLNTNSTLRGVVIYYPDQPTNEVPAPYPWAVALRGKSPAILDCELLNPYNGIDATQNERHLIRNIHGQPLRRGILVDAIYDVGRIENVHFNPWFSMSPKLFQWQMENGEAFIFGRSDWQYVTNTFCFGYKVGYRFTRTKNGVCNGNFLGIGADDCHTSVVIEDSAIYGLLITNGEFVSFRGPDPTMVRVEPGNTGVARFVNCAFWGPCNQIAVIDGKGIAGFSDCTFVQWDGKNENRPAIVGRGGTVMVQNCTFREDKPQVQLSAAVSRAVVTGNVVTGRIRIDNQSPNAVVANNVGDQPSP